MALTINTKIVNDADNYSLDAKQVKGGYGVVDTQAALASLPVATIVEGSLYYVQESDKYYLYNGTTWQEAKFGGVWGDITGTIDNQTDLIEKIEEKATAVIWRKY